MLNNVSNIVKRVHGLDLSQYPSAARKAIIELLITTNNQVIEIKKQKILITQELVTYLTKYCERGVKVATK